jgi:nucleoside-diphosphate-sugar epimerase
MLEGKRILITGATGQMAGALAEGLAKTSQLIAIARFTEAGSRKRLEGLGIETVKCDFTSGDFTGVPDDVDYVVHAAANTHPKDAEAGMRDNAEGTGLLMAHCRKAKGFLHVSSTAVYANHPDPEHVYKETDNLGGATAFATGISGEGERRQSAVAFPMYGITKAATEGVVRAMARALGLPATIARLNVAYGGPYFDGGLPGRQLEALLDRAPIRLTKGVKIYQCPIHEDDLTAHVGPLLAAARVPATITNWGGDDAVSVEDWVRYIADLIGVEPVIEFVEGRTLPSFVLDNAVRKSLGCVCKVDWRTGMRRMIERRHPELKLKPAA